MDKAPRTYESGLQETNAAPSPWAGRLPKRIAKGLDAARETHREIDEETARRIAFLLGRATGPGSVLTDFAFDGGGAYEDLRDEYLELYADPAEPLEVREWINWLGTYLIARQRDLPPAYTSPGDQPPALESLLVPNHFKINGFDVQANVPASFDRAEIEEVTELLSDLRVGEDPALQAYLQLPDANPLDGDVMESFHEHYTGSFPSMPEVVHGLLDIDQFESDVRNYAAEFGLHLDGVLPDYELLMDRLSEMYDFVEKGGLTYVFER